LTRGAQGVPKVRGVTLAFLPPSRSRTRPLRAVARPAFAARLALVSALSSVLCSAACSQNGKAHGAGGTAQRTAGSAGNEALTAKLVTPPPSHAAYTYAADVENTSADCPVPSLPAAAQLPKIEKLPDPFKRLDGTRISKRSEWRCRRQELLKQAEKYIYGQKPPKPALVTGSVTSEKVAVDVEHEGKRIHFEADMVLPAQGKGPFPAIINLGGKARGTTLGESFLLEQGVAVIYYNHYDLGKEGKPEASRGLPNPGLFYDLYGSTHSAGLLMAWAWGASRLLDVLQTSGGSVIDATRVGVTGCSRNGKGAFTVSVFDERIALTIPQETSTAGVPALRIMDALTGTERTNHNYFGLNWLSNDFEPFVQNASQLPIDTHELVALIAPRGLLILDNPHIQQFGAPAAHTAVLGGAEVYKALGALSNLTYISDIENERHCAPGKPEYREALVQGISKFLKHQGEALGTIKASPKATGDLSQWRDWQTALLEKD
jgi:hypothetical protein